jgi:diguanylate cyclase (GGDEF)-like protein
MYVDMDNFKQLNDTHGHAMGDRALKAVSRLLQSTVRDCDIVGRMGGDEFTVIALDADGTGAKAIQKRLDERLALFNASGELPATLALTVGHTRVRPSDSAALHELLARADQLLYARKRRRRLTTANASRHQHAAQHTAQHTAQPAPATRRPARLAPMPIPPAVAAVAHAAAMALPNAGVPVSHTLPVAVPGTLIPTHAA